MRRLKSHPVTAEKNSLHQWWRAKNPLVVVWQFLIITVCRFLPSLQLKIYRLIGAKVGKNTSFGLMSMIDIFFPEMVNIGENCIIGFDTVILGHEFLITEYRTGPVEIGNNVMIGANCTILAGVVIGDGAVIGAGTVVSRDVPPGSFVVGTQMLEVKKQNSHICETRVVNKEIVQKVEEFSYEKN